MMTNPTGSNLPRQVVRCPGIRRQVREETQNHHRSDRIRRMMTRGTCLAQMEKNIQNGRTPSRYWLTRRSPVTRRRPANKRTFSRKVSWPKGFAQWMCARCSRHPGCRSRRTSLGWQLATQLTSRLGGVSRSLSIEIEQRGMWTRRNLQCLAEVRRALHLASYKP